MISLSFESCIVLSILASQLSLGSANFIKARASNSSASASSLPFSDSSAPFDGSGSGMGMAMSGGGGGGGGPVAGGSSAGDEVSTCTEEHPCFPWPNVTESSYWSKDSISKAKTFVSHLNITDKISIISSSSKVSSKVSQLGFPGLNLKDGAYGVADSTGVSGFLSSLSLAASWDKDLMNRIGVALGEEFSGKGYTAQSPVINLYRTPLSGRAKESFGADPYLSGEAAYQVVSGYKSTGTQCVAKHFLLNDDETNRSTVSKNADMRTIQEIYLVPWGRAIEAGLSGAMCAMNQVNGSWSCSNSELLNAELKSRFGFSGFVVPDVGGQKSEVVAALNGLDYGDWTDLESYISNGTFPESRLDDMAERIIGAWYSSGQDSNPLPTSGSVTKTNVQGNHSDLITEAGRSGIVLLKNENNALPLSNPRGISIIGEDGGPSRRGPNGFDSGSFLSEAFVVDGHSAGQGEGCPTFPWLVSPLEALQSRARKSNTAITWSLNNSDISWIPELAQGVSAYGDFSASSFGIFETTVGPIDASIVFVNTYGGEGFDLTTWSLSSEQEAMILNVADNFNNTIVVMNSGNSINVESFADHSNITAIVWQGFSGENSGESLAEILYGDYSPSGHLPFTWGKNLSDYPAQISSSSQVNYTEGLLIDYTWFDENNIEPRWPFGHGLSYSTFSWSDLRLSLEIVGGSNEKRSSSNHSNSSSGGSASNSSSSSPSSSSSTTLTGSFWKSLPTPQADLNSTALTASFNLKNTGTMQACAVSQLYLKFPSSAGEPKRLLKGFEKTCIDRNEESKVEMKLKKRDLSYFDVEQDSFVLAQSQYEIYVGADSRDFRMNSTFTL